jgi:hypothetical protein
MVDIECPFCDGTVRMDATAFTAELSSFRCEACGVDAEITDLPMAAMALAA